MYRRIESLNTYTKSLKSGKTCIKLQLIRIFEDLSCNM